MYSSSHGRPKAEAATHAEKRRRSNNALMKTSVMKSTKSINALFAAGAVVTLLSACIPSVHPFFMAKDMRFDPQLLGKWQQKDDSDGTWKFERAEDESYKLTVTEKGNKKSTCDAHLFKLKEELFLDIIPNDLKLAEDQADLVGAAVFPGHLLVRIGLSGSQLKLTFFDFDWVEKYLKEHPTALAHHLEHKRILFTAETQKLQ